MATRTRRAALLGVTAALAVMVGGCGDSRGAPAQAALEIPVGQSASFSLYVHCGVEYATLDGRTWLAKTRLPDPGPRPGPSGSMTYDGYVHGTMHRVSDDTARFESSILPPVVFHVTDLTPPGCD